ncbi:S-layer homology domain-containing protein [Megamonas funiformis]|uniref:S-layer homology domain-containing protein n=1 Tax=Megamonas funiformis TaxID=437897 RepID=UPI0022DF5664|nr:S-layer homology domain-containing protein [Megamonas funiformis]
MFNKSTLTITTSALVLMSTGVAGAASNPFSDVPQDSWAYDAVATLAADGVIDGFPDGTYQGNKTMTRYEMAQIVARAMAKEDLQKADKAIVDKLAAEFAEELDNLGVRVADLEKKSDNVKFTGTARLRYDDGDINATGPKADWDKDSASHAHIEYWIKGKVNDNWTGVGQIETEYNMKSDSITAYGGDNLQVNKAYAEGNFGDSMLKLGRYGEFSSYGRIIDTEISGAEYTFEAGDLSGALTYGRIKEDRTLAGTKFENKADKEYGAYLGTEYSSARLKYNLSPVTAIGATYGRLNEVTVEEQGFKDSVNFWEAGFNTKLADNLTLMAAYSKSDLDGVTDSVGSEVVNDGWFSELRYKQHNPSDVGSFAIFTNYRNVGAFSTIDATVDYTENVRGWTLGFDYVPMENTTIEVFYTTGTQVNATSTEGRQDVDIFRAQMEFYF